MTMRKWLAVVLAAGSVFAGVLLDGGPARADSKSDETAIRALNEHLAAAFKARDIDAIMSAYVADDTLFAFDAVPPRQYVGIQAYRTSLEKMLGVLYPGPITEFTITDLAITTDGNLGASHRIDHLTLTDRAKKQHRFVWRVTDIYRKSGGTWRIQHEHISFPANPVTAKADMLSKE